MEATTSERVERRHGAGKQHVSFFPILAFLFSAVGFIGWLIPSETTARAGAGGVSPLLGFMFAIMTLITGLAVALNYYRGRTFERRS